MPAANSALAWWTVPESTHSITLRLAAPGRRIQRLSAMTDGEVHADLRRAAARACHADRLAGLDKWRHALRVVYNPGIGRAFRRFLDAVQPRLLHAHNIYGGLTTAVLDVARDAGLPVVLTAHDYKLVCPSYLALDHGRVCTACEGGRFYRCLLKRCHKSSLAASALYTAEAYLAAWGRKYAVVRRILCASRFMHRRLLGT